MLVVDSSSLHAAQRLRKRELQRHLVAEIHYLLVYQELLHQYSTIFFI
jgi:hypothetical protein